MKKTVEYHQVDLSAPQEQSARRGELQTRNGSGMGPGRSDHLHPVGREPSAARTSPAARRSFEARTYSLSGVMNAAGG